MLTLRKPVVVSELEVPDTSVCVSAAAAVPVEEPSMANTEKEVLVTPAASGAAKGSEPTCIVPAESTNIREFRSAPAWGVPSRSSTGFPSRMLPATISALSPSGLGVDILFQLEGLSFYSVSRSGNDDDRWVRGLSVSSANFRHNLFHHVIHIRP